nr:ATP-binding protein [uncultured Albidiferax sp.]
MNHPHSLAARLTRSLLWTIGLAWMAVACSSAWYAQVEINEGMDNTLIDTGHRLMDLALHDLKPTDFTASADSSALAAHPPTKVQRGDIGFAEDYLVYQVVDASRRVLLRSQDAPVAPLAAALTNGFTDLPRWRVYTYQHPDLPLFIHVGDSVAHRREAQQEITFWLLLPILGVLPFLALLIYYTTRRNLAPLQHLSQQIGQRNGQNLAAISGTALPTELQTITDSTNHLLHRLGEALDTERALAANAAHELRTPLATTLLRLHALLELPLEPDAKVEATKALESLLQLNRRAEKLLQMSRAESAAALSWEPVNLGALAGTVVQDFWAQTDLLDRLHLRVPTEYDVLALGDFDALAIVLRNLVENAVHHSNGSVIEVVVELPATLRVRDFGPGVPQDKLQRMRQRHVKNTHNAAGYGLGMSIVSTVVERHRGRLELASPPPGYPAGFEASVHLPVAAG